MTEDSALKDLKESGYIFQKDSEHFTVRLRIPGGDLTSEQLMAVGKIAQDWGKGEIHITTRQGIEVPWIKFEDLKEVTRILDEVGTPPGSCGPRVRNVSSCVRARVHGLCGGQRGQASQACVQADGFC